MKDLIYSKVTRTFSEEQYMVYPAYSPIGPATPTIIKKSEYDGKVKKYKEMENPNLVQRNTLRGLLKASGPFKSRDEAKDELIKQKISNRKDLTPAQKKRAIELGLIKE